MTAGERFGAYRLLRRIAYGGMAEIFLASMDRDRGFEKRVVLKRILPQLSADAAFVQMFVDEAVVAGRLSHPNIVQVHDFGNVEGQYFIAMELVEGADLRHLLQACDERGEHLGPSEVAAIGEAVARGLAYAHALADERLGPLGIVHRDVTPHNVLVSRAGEVKVTDFGIAKAAARATRTATGVLKGKVAYMAPEQAAGDHVDARADQFSLGVVLWECLSGRRLFEGGSDLEVLQRVLACQVPPVRDVRPELPPELAAIVMRCLARDRNERFPDMSRVEQALASFRYSLGTRGAVRLGELVDRLVPRREGREVTPERHTKVLAAPEDDGPKTAREPATALEPARAIATVLTTLEPVRLSDGSGVPGSRRRSPTGPKMAAALAVILIAVTAGLRLGRGGSGDDVADVPAVSLESEPPGASVFVDGLDVGLVTPATLPLAALDEASITLELRRDGHAAWRQELTRASAGTVVNARLEPLAGAPAEAAPAVIIRPAPPAVAGGAAPAGLAAEGAGAVPALDDASPPASHDLAAERARPGGASPPASHDRTAARRRPGPESARRTAGVATGWLSLRSAGAWVDVFLGTRKIGTTPLDRVVVPAGPTRLRLVNREAGIDEQVELEVPAGAELRRTVRP